MKWPLVLLLLVVIGCSREIATPSSAKAQSDGCTLSAWVMQQQPHSTRTLEPPTTDLRDTVIVVNGVSQKISIPPGFSMSVFALIDTVRGLACSPDGVIYATSYGGAVYALPDHHHLGRPDSIINVVGGLGDPHGIGFYQGKLYVSNNAGLYHLITTGQDRVAQSKVLVSPLPASGGHHSRNFVFDTLKKKIYVQVGSNGNTDTTNLAHRAQIVEMNIDGSGYRTFARGIRNVWDSTSIPAPMHSGQITMVWTTFSDRAHSLLRTTHPRVSTSSAMGRIMAGRGHTAFRCVTRSNPG